MIVTSRDRVPEGALNPTVLVIGAGAIGLTLGIALARQGIPVTVVEAGSAGPVSPEYVAANRGPNTGAHHDGILDGRVKALGGTTTLWGGQLVPFGPVDFEPAYPGAPTWPVTYDEMAPWLKRAYSFLKLDAAVVHKASVLSRLGIDPELFGERFAFSMHVWLREPDFTRLFSDELKTLPSLTILTDTEALRFEYSPSGRVTGVQCRAGGGANLQITAQQVVLANGTMEISRQLLRSAATDQNCPFSDNKHLGRGFIDHLHGIVGCLENPDRRRLRDLFDTAFVGSQKYTFKLRASDGLLIDRGISNCAATLNGSGSPRALLSDIISLAKRVFAGGGEARLRDAVGGALSAARVLVPLAWRYLTTSRTYSFVGNKIYLGLELEQVSTQKSYLFLDETENPVDAEIGVHWDYDGRELEAARTFLEELSEEFKRLGLGALVLDQRTRDAVSVADLGLHDANHHIGGARMARTPEEGVVDRNLLVFGTENLYVAGAATFPSGSFANPTLTAIALALRLAETLGRRQPCS